MIKYLTQMGLVQVGGNTPSISLAPMLRVGVQGCEYTYHFPSSHAPRGSPRM